VVINIQRELQHAFERCESFEIRYFSLPEGAIFQKANNFDLLILKM
jgi:hypothetical protein